MRRRLLVGLSWLIAFIQMGASAEMPAEVVAETRLGPAAGNATHPFAAAMDTRRNRLWVLNRVPQSLAVVDMATRRMVGTVPLAAPVAPRFEGWFNSDPYIWMGYDSRSDRILVGSGNSVARSALVSVDAGTRKIAATRTFGDRLAYRWAINVNRGEVVVAGMGATYPGGFGMLIVDSRTLVTRGDFATNRQIVAIAASARTGRVYTVEPSAPHPASAGMGGPYSATRVFVRNTGTGAITARSAGEYSYPDALLVDDAGDRLYLTHRSARAGVQVISSESNAVTALSQSTLQAERRIQFAAPNPNGRKESLSWSTAWLDAVRRRLVVDFSGGTVGILRLTGPAKSVKIPVEGSLYSEYRLAGVIASTGQPILLIDNAVCLLNAGTMRAGARISLGATIQDLFLDRKRHRLLAHVDRDIHEFLMVANSVPVRLFKSYVLPRTHLLAVDFDRKRIYHVYNDGWGNAASLEVMNFRGESAAGGYHAEGEFAGLIVTDTPGRSFRLLYPAYPESVRALKRCSLDRLENGRETGSVTLQQHSASERAPQLCYAARVDRVYVVSAQTIATYAGSDLKPLGTISLAALSENRPQRGMEGSVAVDADGEFAFYADVERQQIAKLRLADGSVVARRELTFTPTLPLVDSDAGRIYVADNAGGRIIAIRLF